MGQQSQPAGTLLHTVGAQHGVPRHRSPRLSAGCRMDRRHLPPQDGRSTGTRCSAGAGDAGQKSGLAGGGRAAELPFISAG